MTENAPPAAIARQFMPEQTLLSITPLGNGLINDTYLVTHQNLQWVLQRINRQVFPEPRWLSENLTVFAQHIRHKTSASKRLQIPEMLYSPQNQAYIIDAEGDYWRALQFIPNSYSKEQLESLQDAEQMGWALGCFHTLCSDLNPALLHDTLPGFHIAPNYLKDYQQALRAANSTHQADQVYQYCVTFIARRQVLLNGLEDAKHNGDLTLRIMHGDPKVNNFLFDHQTAQVISLIDLDTVKPGLIHYDIGDCLRSACFNADTHTFELTICEAILKSYLTEVKHFFTEADYHYLYLAIQLLPLELGIRFLTDYLQGNRYFKVTDPTQNLHRAMQQFRLCDNIEQQQLAIERLIQRLR